ncbi:MAG TPA: phosphoglycerate dehydrogenase [Anaerolineaceae bacterium]|nr:phosphoglycerate dehydrogenase [Anaerolineaceae bacterium]HPS32536.1 phosphoglycerate dehydrogenase [Anaerolineaceae bacterium]
MKDVLISAPYMLPFLPRFTPVLEQLGMRVLLPEVHERLSEEELLAYAGRFDGTICGDDRYTRRVIQACLPRLKVISKWGTGIDSIDQEAAAEFGVSVRNTPNAFTVPVAESVLGYMLNFARHFSAMDSAMKAGEWQKIPGYTLSEKTLGVVGVGNVGKAVLRRARAFGMKLLGNDIIEIAPDFLLENSVEAVPLRELLERADFISLNCSLTPSSYHLINAQTLSLVKPGALLINTSRGPVVEEPALVRALQAGRLAGAALDVFEVEPLPADSPLLTMKNVLLAPHNSNSSPFYWERVHWNSIRNLALGLDLPVGDIASIKALEKQA